MLQRKIGVNILFICEDIKEKIEIFFTGGRKGILILDVILILILTSSKFRPS